MLEGITIGGIVAAAVVYLAIKFYHTYKSDDPCKGCSCGHSTGSSSKNGEGCRGKKWWKVEWKN